MKIPHESHSPAIQRILSILHKKSDMSASDLSNEAFVGLTTLSCGGYLKTLKAKRLIHISGWRKTHKGFVTPLYSLGDKADLPRPEFTDADRDSVGMGTIVDALHRFGMMTYLEVAEKTGLSANTIKTAKYMDILVKQNRIHIARWRRNKAGPMTAVFAYGEGESAEKPAPLSRAEANKRYRTKKEILTSPRQDLASQLNRLGL